MTPGGKRVVLVAAVARNGVIGVDGRLPWHLPGELAHFRRVTTGHCLVMGRRTFASIGRPLPRRTTIVVTRQPDWTAQGVLVASSIREALVLADSRPGEVRVVGGAAVYAEAMPLADAQVLTEVPLEPAGDVRYPEIDPREWREVRREPHEGFDVVWFDRA